MKYELFPIEHLGLSFTVRVQGASSHIDAKMICFQVMDLIEDLDLRQTKDIHASCLEGKQSSGSEYVKLNSRLECLVDLNPNMFDQSADVQSVDIFSYFLGEGSDIWSKWTDEQLELASV